MIAAAPEDAQIYACGPDRLLAALEQIACASGPSACTSSISRRPAAQLDPDEENPFEVELKDSQLSLSVPADQTLLQALHATGIDVPSDCEEGLCGTCEVPVVAGDVDHRDKVLSAAERAAGGRMMACCSRPLAVPSERPHRQGGRRLPFGARRLVEPGVMAGSRALRARAPPRQTW